MFLDIYAKINDVEPIPTAVRTTLLPDICKEMPVEPVLIKEVAVITPVTFTPFVNVGAAPLKPVIVVALILDISNLLWV
jgi:hypothetical protein